MKISVLEKEEKKETEFAVPEKKIYHQGHSHIRSRSHEMMSIDVIL